MPKCHFVEKNPRLQKLEDYIPEPINPQISSGESGRKGDRFSAWWGKIQMSLFTLPFSVDAETSGDIGDVGFVK
jgi:hypothetical protein